MEEDELTSFRTSYPVIKAVIFSLAVFAGMYYMNNKMN